MVTGGSVVSPQGAMQSNRLPEYFQSTDPDPGSVIAFRSTARSGIIIYRKWIRKSMECKMHCLSAAKFAINNK